MAEKIINGIKLPNSTDTYVIPNRNIVDGTAAGAVKTLNRTTNNNNIASGVDSFAEGKETSATGDKAHAEGYNTTASGDQSHAEGNTTEATKLQAHAEGQETKAENNSTHTEGYRTLGLGESSHAEGEGNEIPTQINKKSYATAKATDMVEEQLIRMGNDDRAIQVAFGKSSHVEGKGNVASGLFAHAEGGNDDEFANNLAEGTGSHAEGAFSRAQGNYSHSEGESCIAQKEASHAEGYITVAKGNYSHSEGQSTKAIGESSHAEGSYCTASGEASHTEGQSCTATGIASHAEGKSCNAKENYQSVRGKYNADDANAVDIVGWGNSNTRRKNIYALKTNGDIEISGTLKAGLSMNAHYEPAWTDTNVSIYCGSFEMPFSPDGTTITVPFTHRFPGPASAVITSQCFNTNNIIVSDITSSSFVASLSGNGMTSSGSRTFYYIAMGPAMI